MFKRKRSSKTKSLDPITRKCLIFLTNNSIILPQVKPNFLTIYIFTTSGLKPQHRDTTMKGSRASIFSLFLVLVAINHFSLSAAAVSSRFPAGLVGSKALQRPAKVAYEIRNFRQNLDHFDYQPQSYQTFQQKYLFDDRHWGGAKNGSPIFLYTGNEGNIEFFAQNTGFMFDVAPYFKALLVFIEVGNKFLSVVIMISFMHRCGDSCYLHV